MPYSYQYSILSLRENIYVKMKNIIIITLIVEQPVLIFLTQMHNFFYNNDGRMSNILSRFTAQQSELRFEKNSSLNKLFDDDRITSH